MGDMVRVGAERGQFHCGYMEDYTREVFTIAKVLKNLPFPRYILNKYNGKEMIGFFFIDEFIKYKPSDTYPINVLKKKKSRKGEECIVHYIGWPSSYDEWKLAKDVVGRYCYIYGISLYSYNF